MLRTSVAAALAAAMLLVPATVFAQDAADPEYERVLREALREYDAGRYSEARALFTRAHAIQPNARTLRGVGMASFELREYVLCLRALQESLTHPVRPLTTEQGASVRGLIDRARTFVGRFVVNVSPPNATLRVDGAPAELEADGAILLDLGDHRFEARCDGCETATRTVTVRGGEDEAISLEAGSALSRTVDGVDDPGSPTEPRDSGSSLPGIVLLATAGAFAGAAVGAGVWWAGRGSEVARCEEAGAACSNLSALQSEQTVAGAFTIGLIAASAATATVGVILLVGAADDEGEDEAASGTLACGPALLGVSCAGTF